MAPADGTGAIFRGFTFARATIFLAHVRVLPANKGTRVSSGSERLYEIKHDGYRQRVERNDDADSLRIHAFDVLATDEERSSCDREAALGR